MSISFWIAVIALVAAFIFSVPLSLGLICSGVLYLLTSGADLGIVADKILSGMFGNYTILAVPMFVLMANVMNSSDVTMHMFKFAKACIGKQRGALAQVNVLISTIFAGMSGSAVADASGIGMIEMEAMREDGYDEPFSAALTAATSTIGPIIPPSIPMVNYAMLSGASVGALFMGGIIPGLMLALVLSAYVAWISKKRNYPRGIKYTPKEFLHYFAKAFPALLTIIILLVGIYCGIMTPTEASAVAAGYAVFVSVFYYKSFTFKQFFQTVKDTALQTGRITIMTAASFIVSYIVANEGVAVKLAQVILSITTNKIVLLLIINAVFFVLGMLIDVSVLQWVFIPLVLPLVNALGIDLIHFGVTIILNMMIGLSSPPFGMCLFIVSNVSNSTIAEVSKEIIPMLVVMLAFVLLLIFCPGFVTFLPTLMG